MKTETAWPNMVGADTFIRIGTAGSLQKEVGLGDLCISTAAVREEGHIAVKVKPEHPVGLFTAYWRNPDATAESFVGDWYYTGDRAYKDEDGYFWFVGRSDDVIKASGYRIGPFEVESALQSHPAVAESAVVGSPDELRGTIVKAFVILAPGCTASPGPRKDTRIPNEILQHSLFFVSGSAETQRSTLLTIATTILATAGVVFTLLTLPLSTVAAQYGSRLLRLFLGDHITQFVLGMFVATFVYCLAAALTIPPAAIHPDGPQLTVMVGLLLMLGTFASLIMLVQHIATMLQAPKMAAAAGANCWMLSKQTSSWNPVSPPIDRKAN